MEFLTERQLQVLKFIRRTIDERGIAPTLREISDTLGCSSTAAGQKHVGLLIKKNYLKREKHQKRGIVLTSKCAAILNPPAPRPTEIPPDNVVPMPRLDLLGTVAAGSPIESYPDVQQVSVPPEMLRSGNHYALRVRGDSMIEDGIHDGDLVVIQHAVEAADGTTVVALVDSEVTLKRIFRPGDGTVRLEPANADMEAIVCRADQVSIQGIVVGLLRNY